MHLTSKICSFFLMYGRTLFFLIGKSYVHQTCLELYIHRKIQYFSVSFKSLFLVYIENKAYICVCPCLCVCRMLM